MITADLDLGPWRDGETARFVACRRHTGALHRLEDFERACDIAEACPRCLIQYRKDTPPS